MKKILLLTTLFLTMLTFGTKAQVPVFTEGFESGSIPAGWTTIDADNDGFGWEHSSVQGDLDGSCHTGSGAYVSYSYDNTDYEALTPDNWLVSPAITLSGTSSLTYWFVVASSYPSDHYGVYVSTTSASDPTAFTLLYEETPTASNGNWTMRTVDLTAYAGNTVYIAFRHYNCTDMLLIALDDITVYSGSNDESVLAVNPSAVSFGNVQLNDMSPVYTVQVSAYNITAAISASVNAPFEISADSLSFSSTASLPVGGGSLYVRFTPTAVGSYQDSVTITADTYTQTVALSGNCVDCNNFTLPFSESFENVGDLFCWVAGNASSTNPNSITLSSAYASQGSHSLCFSSYSHASDYSQYAITPELPVTSEPKMLTFDYRTSSSANETFRVGYSTTDTYISSFTWLAEVVTEDEAKTNWMQYMVASIPGEAKYIAIHYYSNYMYYLYVDNFVVEEASGCLPSASLEANNITAHSAELSWLGSADAFNLYYKAQNDTGYTMEPNITLTDNVYLLNNLAASTQYQFYVENICGDEVSNASNVASFITLCDVNPASSLPLTYNFELDTQYEQPLCWTLVEGYSGYYGTRPYVYNSSSYAHDGTNCLQFYPYGNNNVKNIIAMPAVDEEIHDLRVNFWLRPGNNTTSYGTFEVGLMSDIADTSTFETVQTITASALANNSYAQYKVSFANTTISGHNAHIAFRCQNEYGYSWYMDDVTVEYIPTCTEPSNVEVSNITSTDATFTWTAGDSTQTQFTIFYKADGADTYSSQNVEITDGVMSYTLTGLTSATNYQAYMEVECAPGTHSNTVTFYTLCDIITITDDSPYTESFVNPICWDYTGWSLSSSNNYIYHSFGTYDIEALSPIFDLSDVTIPYLKFSHKQPDYSNSGISDDLTIFYRTSADSTWTELASYTNIYSDWTTDSVALASSSTFYQLKFAAYGNGSQANGLYLDDVTVYNNTSSCFAPQAFAISGMTNTSITLTWIPVNDDPINVYYKEEGTATYTEVQNAALVEGFYTLQGLTEATTYSVYIAPACDSTLMSAILSASTPCSAISVATTPYFNDFESYASLSVPTCWTNISTFSYSGENGIEIYPSIDSQYGGNANNKNLLLAAYNNATAFIALPQFVENLNTLRLSFGAKSGYATSPNLQVVVLPYVGANTYEVVGTLNAADYNVGMSTSVPFAPFYLNFDTTDVTSGVIGLLLQHSTGFDFGQWHIDNLKVELIPSCEEPTYVSAVGVTPNSIDLTWQSDAASFDLYYKLAESETYTHLTNVTLSNGIYTLTGLDAASEYLIYVVANCSATESSEPSTELLVSTSCNTENGFPYHESFENGFGCWHSETVVGTTNWFVYGTTETVTTTDGNYFVYFPYTEGASAQLISPVFDLTGLTNPTLKYDLNIRTYYGVTDSLGVYYRTSPTADWTSLATHPTGDGTFVTYTVALPNATSSYEIAFRAYGLDGNGQILDNIFVFDSIMPNVCNTPTALTVNGMTQTEATATWTAGGSETAWKLQYKTDSDANWGSEIAVNTTPSYDFTGLTANTTYQVRVKAVCGADDESDWTSAVTFNTLPENVEPCEVPTGLTATNITADGATITWNNQTGVNSWNIQYGPQGGQLTSATSNTNSYTIAGLTANTTYGVQVQAVCDGNNTSEWSALYTFTTTTGLANHLEQSIVLFPNPAKEYVDIRIDGDIAATSMEVYDVYGKLINTINVIENQNRLNVSSLANGMYFVRVTTEQGVVTKTFVKK